MSSDRAAAARPSPHPAGAPRRAAMIAARAAALALLVAAAGGCGSVRLVQKGPPMSTHARWVLLPLENHSETPLAGERLAALLANVLRARGVERIDEPPPPNDPDAVITQSDRQRFDAALEWGKKQSYTYAIAGSVEEWRYKSSLEAEPAIGISVRVIRVGSDDVIWSGSTSRSGWSHENLTATALKAVDDLVDEMKLAP